MGTLIFFICLVIGIGLFFYIKRSEQKQWKISGEKELKNKQYEHYKSLRIDDPVSEETISLATRLKEYSNHQKWLKEILKVLEEEYKIHNLDIFSSNGVHKNTNSYKYCIAPQVVSVGPYWTITGVLPT